MLASGGVPGPLCPQAPSATWPSSAAPRGPSSRRRWAARRCRASPTGGRCDIRGPRGTRRHRQGPLSHISSFWITFVSSMSSMLLFSNPGSKKIAAENEHCWGVWRRRVSIGVLPSLPRSSSSTLSQLGPGVVLLGVIYSAIAKSDVGACIADGGCFQSGVCNTNPPTHPHPHPHTQLYKHTYIHTSTQIKHVCWRCLLPPITFLKWTSADQR